MRSQGVFKIEAKTIPDFPKTEKKRNPQRNFTALKSAIVFYISFCFIAQSDMRISKSNAKNPNTTHPMTFID